MSVEVPEFESWDEMNEYLESATSIGKRAFYYSKLTSVTIPNLLQ
jgi:hypothetical protein